MQPERHRRPKPNILVTGTPGTGKTTFSRLLNGYLNFVCINVGDFLKEHQLYDSWNEEFDVPEFECDQLSSQLLTKLPGLVQQGGYLLDFHTPDILPVEMIDLVVVITCPNDTLYGRLEERGYTPNKIGVNIQCQIFQEVKLDAEEYYGIGDHLIVLHNEKEEELQPNLQIVLKWLIDFRDRLNNNQ